MKLLFKVAVLFLFCACTKKEVKYIPYYTFDEIGQSLLSELHVNDTLKFKKANGQIRTYVVLNIEKRKEDVTDCDWIGDHCETFYYYDHLILIVFICLRYWNSFKIWVDWMHDD